MYVRGHSNTHTYNHILHTYYIATHTHARTHSHTHIHIQAHVRTHTPRSHNENHAHIHTDMHRNNKILCERAIARRKCRIQLQERIQV